MKKITERALIKHVLTILALSGPTFSSDLPEKLSKILQLSKKDKELLENRNISNFEQTISNFISHRTLNKIRTGKDLVVFSRIGSRKLLLSITPTGIKYLKRLNKGNS